MRQYSGLLLCLGLFLVSACTGNKTAAVPGKISGTITIKPELAAAIKETDILYIIARREQVGPPSAVKRIKKPTFPLTYVIGTEDAMMPGMGGFENGSNLTLAARVSHSGNAMPSPNDLEGVYPKNPAHPGDGGIDIEINSIRK